MLNALSLCRQNKKHGDRDLPDLKAFYIAKESVSLTHIYDRIDFSIQHILAMKVRIRIIHR